MQETLNELIDKAPQAHEQQNIPLQESDKTLLSSFAVTSEINEQSGEMLKPFEQSLTDFEALNESLIERKNTIVTATTETLQANATELTSSYTESMGQFDTSFQNQAEKVEALREHIKTEQESLLAAQQSAQQSMESSQVNIAHYQETLEETFNETNEAINTLQESIETAKSELTEETETLFNTLQESQSEALSKTVEIKDDSLVKLHEEFVANTGNVMELMGNNFENMTSEVQTEIEQKLKEVINEMVGELVGKLDEVGEKLIGASSESDALFSQLKDTLAGLDGAWGDLDSILGTADEVASHAGANT